VSQLLSLFNIHSVLASNKKHIAVSRREIKLCETAAARYAEHLRCHEAADRIFAIAVVPENRPVQMPPVVDQRRDESKKHQVNLS
jgi:hypothetical protein